MTQFDLHLPQEGTPQRFRKLTPVYANAEGIDTTDLSTVVWEANASETIVVLQPQADGTVDVITAGTGGLGSVDITYSAKAQDGLTPVDLSGSATITVIPAAVVPVSVTVDILAADESAIAG